MRFTLILLVMCVLLTACRTNEGELRRQIVGTWTWSTQSAKPNFSWKDPLIFTRTISSDGSFTETLGHRSEPVIYQGTWRITDGSFVTTITNAQGTGNHQPSLSEIGQVKHWKILRLDDHQFVYTADGHTNSFTR